MKLKKALKLINEICLANTHGNGKSCRYCPLFTCNPLGCCLHKADLQEQDFEQMAACVKSWKANQKSFKRGVLPSSVQVKESIKESIKGTVRAH